MEASEAPVLKMRTANDWIRESKKRPIPAALSGEFWREGETAVLFADTGKGKSALAMQIAQSIASGVKIKPFRLAVKPQKVLYLDLEMNDKQFEARHAADHEGGRSKFLRKHFVFSDNLCREELDAAEFWVRGEKTSDVFRRKLRQLVMQYDAKVVIIDSLTCLKRSYYGSREILDLITAVKKLQREMNISILALIQTPKQAEAQALSVNSLRGMKLLCSRADSVFGIGQSRFDTFGRYLKRVKSLSDTMDFDAMHVPTFRVKKLGGNFLGFEFQEFMPEAELLSDIRSSKEWDTIERIKQLRDSGMSFRAIAAEIELPTTTVHRLLQMWRPPQKANVPAPEPYDPTTNEFYFPGREEYDEAKNDPKFKLLYDPYIPDDDSRYRLLMREYGLIDNACARARQIYKDTGAAPKLCEDARYAEFMNLGSAISQSGQACLTDGDSSTHRSEAQPPSGAIGDQSSGQASLTAMDRGKPPAEEWMNGLKHRLNAYGKDIWVEIEGNNPDKPIKWHSLDSKGRKQPHVRNSLGVGISREPDPDAPIFDEDDDGGDKDL